MHIPPLGISSSKRTWIGVLTGAVSAGVVVGYAACGNPWVIVTVPLGIAAVLGAIGAGVGLALGCAEGFRYLTLRLMRVPEMVTGPQEAPRTADLEQALQEPSRDRPE